MDCEINNCNYKEECHTNYPKERKINDIPIVPGEVSTEKDGLYSTIPKAINGKKGMIVYSHALFITGKKDFNEVFYNLFNIEKEFQKGYFEIIN